MRSSKSGLIATLLIAGLMLHQVQAQIPDDTNGRLYRLCKAWGYVKYFNQNKCEVVWDELLNNTINEVLVATSNAEFNNSMIKFLNQAGNSKAVANPPAMPDTNLLVNTDWINDPVLSNEVRDFMVSFSSHVYPDQLNCFVRITGIPDPAGYSLIDFSQDPIALPIDYTIESHRLTVVFYYWNLINYFFPYRNLMDQPWDITLEEFIPIFRQSATDLQFHTNFLKLVAHINDSHGTTRSTLLYNYFWKGLYYPKVRFERIENQCVVTKVGGMIGITPGDILTGINGTPIGVIEDSLATFIAASNEAAMYRNIYNYMLRGGLNSEVNFTLSNKNEETYIKSVQRTDYASDWYVWSRDPGYPGSYMKTACGYGYVNMKNLQPDEIPQMYNSLKSAPVIIFDIRNYPNRTLWDLAPLFFKSQFKNVIFYSPALVSELGQVDYNYLPGWYYVENGDGFLGQWSNPKPYTGKIYILVNQETQSQAEYTCQSLSYHAGSKVIGTQTAGADGNISYIRLPGGITTYFTSLGTYYADGSQQQRNGVKIDSVVAPTIKGVREGNDEILLAALDCISGIDNTAINPFVVSVYPNPVTSSTVQVSFTLEQQSEVSISLTDLAGKTLIKNSQYCSAGEEILELDLQRAVPGFYLLKTQINNDITFTKLIVQ